MKNTKMLVLILLIIGIAAGILTFWDILTTFLIAAMFAYLLNPITGYIVRKTDLKRPLAVAIVFFLFIFILIFIISVSAPSIISQMSDLITEMQRYAFNLDNLIKEITIYMTQLHLPKEVMDLVSSVLSESDTYILSFIGSIMTSIVNLSMQLFDLIIVVILIVYFMLDGPMLIRSIVSALPEKAEKKVSSLIGSANNLTWKYIKSRCIVSGGMAIVTFIGLRIMGIKYALLFAVISFFLDFIPYFGSFIAGVIEAFYALLTSGLSLAIGVGIFVIIVQQVEGNIISPKVQGDAAGIHPITVMFALLACNKIWGTMGMLISVPVAAILKLIFKELYSYVVSKEEPEETA
ncbi:MAG: AI-2E family transporter [Clostridiaceae bacterium]|nr:AI-2E family transporter [Clostridiaceae bacterium]